MEIIYVIALTPCFSEGHPLVETLGTVTKPKFHHKISDGLEASIINLNMSLADEGTEQQQTHLDTFSAFCSIKITQ